MDLDLDTLPCTDLSGGDGVGAGLEGHQAVFAYPAQGLLGDQIRQLG